MISLGAFMIVLAALAVTLFILLIVLLGSAEMRAAERKRTDTAEAAYRAEVAAHERTREALRDLQDETTLPYDDDVLLIPLAESDQAQRIAALIAHNEAERHDPDLEDWSPVLPEDRA